jgi:Domain of unknown function (DUF4465)
MKNYMALCVVLVSGVCASAMSGAATIDFEDVEMANERPYAGPGGGRYWSGLQPPSNGSINSSYSTGGARFLNNNSECCGGAVFWDGFAYSNTTDTTTQGNGNEISAYAGGGAGNSANYAVAYAGGVNAPRIEFDVPTLLQSAMLTNTTYTALSMRDGDFFAKKFGGANGTDPDFLKLTITGRDAANVSTGTVDFYLADFRADDSAQDYILDVWSAVTLTSLGQVSALEFSFASSDVGQFGINTPVYFALDNIQAVPVPAAGYLLGPALAVVLLRRRKVRA